MHARRIAQVNFLSRIIRAFFSAILLGGIVSLLRLRALGLEPASTGRAPSPRSPVPLYRDPNCGTFVSPEISVRAERNGRVEHFCCEQCRERYLSLPQSAPGGTARSLHGAASAFKKDA